jgi:predicted TIM-barrel fold metal-dependent hydrolase
VSEALERALKLSAGYDAELGRLLPAGADIFDAHLHLGQDIDGMVGDDGELAELMARYGISRAFVFCLDEPDRHPAFSAANDRTLSLARRAEGRLVPFVRLDLNENPLEEARRCLDAGARGIKLHPRAQGFGATDARLGPVFELAAERQVPILIHGGRGLPPIAEGLAALVERNPDATLIIAHAGIADMGALSTAMAGRRRVFFDTSAWSPIDLLELYRRIPPEQILFASDYPYGQQPASLLLTVLTALRAGYDEQKLRGLLAGNANRIADGDELPAPTHPLGSATLDQPLALARIHQYVSMAIPILWARQPDAFGVLALAINACSERDGHAEPLARIGVLLESVDALWRTLPDLEDPGERFRASRLAFRLLHIADIEAVTTA